MEISGQLELFPVVKIAQKDQDRFWSKVVVGAKDECWLWQAGKEGKGYGNFWLAGRPIKTHRLVWVLTNGPIPDGLLVCHTCDTPACVNPAHLFLGTNYDNMHDAWVKGRMATGDRSGARRHPESLPRGDKNGRRTQPERTARGSRVGIAKLTDEKVFIIMARLKAGESQRRVAREFGVNRGTVQAIWDGRSWSHLFKEGRE